MKKLLAAFFALALVFSVSSCGKTGANSESGEGGSQSLTDTGAATTAEQEITESDSASQEGFITDEIEDGICIDGYNGTASKIVIPSSIDGKPVVSIAYLAFCGNETIKKLVIPETVKMIGTRAFWKCKSLESITFNEGIEIIDEGAFSDCYKITSVVFPSSIKEIRNNAFVKCSNLKTIEFVGAHDLKIRQNAFGETAVENIILPEGVTEVGHEAFSYMPLKTVYIPASVTSIDPAAFMYSATDLTIRGKASSVAESYAKEQDIPFVTE